MSFTLIVTNAGRAALVNASRDGTNAVRIAAVGLSATALTASATTASLPGEIKRVSTISGDAVAPDTIHVTVRDESNGAYSVRSIALYLADGTLFAAYGQADVLVEKSAQAMLLLALDVRLADISAASLTFGATNFLNPPATTEVQGVVELATDAETSAGTDDRRSVTPKGLIFTLSARLSAWGSDIWRASNDGAGSGLDADLLDGQDGSFYTNIIARLGYTPARNTGDTFTGSIAITNGGILYHEAGAANYGVCRFQRQSRVRWDMGMGVDGETGGNFGSNFFISRYDDGGNFLGTVVLIDRGTGEFRLQGQRAWHAGNDGAGSGLDADLLDGQDSSYFANIPARLGYTPVQQGTGVGQLPNTVKIGWSGTRVKVTIDASDMGNVVFDNHIADVWRASNDGAGSGLDADLLDGQDSSFYTNIAARLGYVPANKAGTDYDGPISAPTPNAGTTGGLRLRSNATSGFAYLQITNADLSAEWGNLRFDAAGQMRWNGSFQVLGEIARAGARVWDAANDGAGSGLDADLLDGQDSSYFANIPARLGYTPVQQGTGFGQMPNTVKIGWSGTRVKVTIDASDMGNVVFDNHIADVWRGSNDGAGSGLDADLLDGFEGAAYDRIVDQRLVENGGYIVYASGRKETWGFIYVGQDSYATYTLPIAHDEWVHPSLGVTSLSGNTGNYQNTGIADIIGSPPTAVQIWNADDRTARVWVRTIGK